jgi:hypothetical protein
MQNKLAMKKLMIAAAFLLMHFFVSAETYLDAKIILNSGAELLGLASLPSDPGPTVLKFKENKNARFRYVYSDSIRTVIYYGKRTLEYDVRLVYETPSHKTIRQHFLLVRQRGFVTLYSYSGMDVIMGVGSLTNVFNGYWACYRDGEPAATMISGTEKKNKKGAFDGAASEYFKDDPPLVARINRGEYHWDDMDKIVEEYNSKKTMK